MDIPTWRKKIVPTNQTLYEWGSLTKIVTHTLMWKLYEEGSVDLNDDVLKYLGNNFFSKKKSKDKITILNLMHHNAGFDDTSLSLNSKTRTSVSDLMKHLQLIEPRTYAKPGEYVAYSNYGVALEGLIIEKVTGKRFSEYVKEEIFMKLGMNHTSIDSSRSDLPNFDSLPRAIGYEKYGKPYKYQDSSILIYPAGSIIGSLDDLSTFINELVPCEGKQSLLFKNQTSLKNFLTVSHRPSENGTGIAHGLFEYFDENRTSVLHHPGNTAAMTSHAIIHSTNGWSICILTNLGTESRVVNEIPNMVLGWYNRTFAGSKINNYEGKFVYTKCAHSGFMAILTNIGTAFAYVNLKKNSENSLKTPMGTILTQIEENLFIPDHFKAGDLLLNNSHYSYVIKHNKVKSAYVGMVEMIKVDSMGFYIRALIGGIIYVISNVVSIIMFITLIIAFISFKKQNESDNPRVSLLTKFVIIGFTDAILNIISLIIALSLLLGQDRYSTMSVYVGFDGVLLALTILKLISIIVAIVFCFVFKVEGNPSKTDGVEIQSDLINEEIKPSQSQENPYTLLKVSFVAPMIAALINSIIGFSLDAFRI